MGGSNVFDLSPDREETLLPARCEEAARIIGFREHPRKHRVDRLLHERTNIELASRSWKYVQACADAKTEVISQTLGRTNATGPLPD